MNKPKTRHHMRKLLLANWLICAAPPGDEGQCAPPERSCWTRIRELMPAAAALRELKEWSLDDTARRFDAQDWWYKLVFDAFPRNSAEPVILGFDGLATIAQVWLNGKLLLVSTNMFVAHECDVSSVLKNNDNELLICFRALDAKLAMPRKRPRWRAPMVAHQQLRWFRTTLLGRTPGWSPPAAVVGPWKDIWLEQRKQFHIKDLCVEVGVNDTAGTIKCHLKCKPLSGLNIDAVFLQLERCGRVDVQRLRKVGAIFFEGQLHLGNVDMWWPHTHGEPSLYAASLRIRISGVPDESVISIGRVGFRTITLETANGNFSLNVNGVSVFCRGACWTPLDPVTLRACPEASRAAVAQARSAGMNILRIAGTMVYEEDHFFDACDEQGMLVWQDLMFANMDYPGDDAEFMASVVLEVGQQLRSLQATACLALLCGNSEVEQQAAMWGAPCELWQPPLFEDTLAQLCADHAPGTPYWPSSAHGGSFPHQASIGTSSYYGVGAYLRPLDDARRANVKFATECLAFANIPAAATIGRMPGGLAIRVHHPEWKARSPRDLGAGWDFDDVRDHYLGMLFHTNPQKLRYTDHDRYLSLGRMVTGEVMAASFAEWRLPQSPCVGAIVLFLRDLWAGAGWGLIDDSGVPKACYYYLKRALQPLTVLLSDEGVNGLFAHVVNERNEERLLELELTAWREGDVLVASGRKLLTVPARSSQSFAGVELLGQFMDLTYAYKFGPMTCDAVVLTLRDQLGNQLAQAFHFPGGLGAQSEIDVGLTAWATMVDAQTAELTVQTKRFAQGVHFNVPGFHADDDYFHLRPNSEARVILRGTGSGPLIGSVHAINSIKSARVGFAALAIGDLHREKTK